MHGVVHCQPDARVSVWDMRGFFYCFVMVAGAGNCAQQKVCGKDKKLPMLAYAWQAHWRGNKVRWA